jgi:hypothetical protein
MDSPGSYRVVFDIARQEFDWRMALYPLLFLPIGIGLIWFAGKSKRYVGYFFVGFSLLLSAITFAVSWRSYAAARSAWRDYAIATVEGPVTDFRPMPYGGHQEECFTVQAKSFCYSDYVVTPGFHNTTSHGGPIREGLQVRISYSGDMILRLEVRADALPSDPERSLTAQQAEKEWRARIEQNPFEQRMTFGFLIGGVFLMGWVARQPRRLARCWGRLGENRKFAVGFRIFYAICAAGAFLRLIQQSMRMPRHIIDYAYGIVFGAGWIALIWLMVRLVEWMNGARNPSGTAP